MTTGERIRTRREELGLSLNGLAKKANISPAYLSALENDKQSEPSLTKARQLATALGTTVDYLFEGITSEQICGNCEFYLMGACYRYPPVPVGRIETRTAWKDDECTVEDRTLWERPEVAKNSWCGEWRPKP